MGTLPQVRHRPEILLLCWRQAIKANAKEAFIERGYRFLRSRHDIVQRNRTALSNVP
jgi:hypothetical protein